MILFENDEILHSPDAPAPESMKSPSNAPTEKVDKTESLNAEAVPKSAIGHHQDEVEGDKACVRWLIIF